MPPRDRTQRRVLPSQERAHASVDAILDAAALLLREQGFLRMTTNRVADRVGVNVSLVYRYFAGKEAIVGALIARTLAQIRLAAEASLGEHAASPLAVAVEPAPVCWTTGMRQYESRRDVQEADTQAS